MNVSGRACMCVCVRASACLPVCLSVCLSVGLPSRLVLFICVVFIYCCFVPLWSRLLALLSGTNYSLGLGLCVWSLSMVCRFPNVESATLPPPCLCGSSQFRKCWARMFERLTHVWCVLYVSAQTAPTTYTLSSETTCAEELEPLNTVNTDMLNSLFFWADSNNVLLFVNTLFGWCW